MKYFVLTILREIILQKGGIWKLRNSKNPKNHEIYKNA